MLRPSLHPRPPLFTPRLHPRPPIVSAKFDRRWKRPDRSTDGFDPWEAIAIASAGMPEPAPKQPPPPAVETKTTDKGTVQWSSGGPLSGSDVLIAMRRAAAAAAAAARKSKKKKGKAKAKASNESEAVGGAEVRPLNVKSDWGRRIEEIENALDQLLKLQS